MSGKDGLNSWVKNVKEFGGIGVQIQWKNFVDKLGCQIWLIQMGEKIVWKNCEKNFCEKIRWNIV